MKYVINDAYFEWDDKKAINNLAKHGVTFEEASTVFLDPFFKVIEATDPNRIEDRDGVVGYSSECKLLFVVYTERCGGVTIRIISARKATAQERMLYEN
jgi:uncharacterized DUF497 family protein